MNEIRIIEELKRRNGRLRKSVNWLRGALHDESPFHHGSHDTCRAWECIRARVILRENKDI